MTDLERPDTRAKGHWDRSIVALLLATFCTSSAHLAGVTALGKQVYDLTGRELDLGLLGLAEFAPAALLVLVTGTVADRFDRRRVAAIGSLAEGACALGLAAYVAGDPQRVGPIFALVVLTGTGRAFVAPSARALPADILPPDELPWLVARHSATWQAALIAGPVLGGTLYAVDPVLPYLAMVVLFVASAVAMAFVRIRRHEPHPVEDPVATVATAAGEGHLEAPVEKERPTLHHALEGLRFIRSQPVLLGAISLDLFAVLFGGAVALLPAIAEERLGVGAVGLGWLRAAGGIGAAAVTLTLARRPIRRRVGRRLLLAVALFGLGTIVLGLTTSYVVAFTAMLVLSGADAISVFIRATLVPLITPHDTRGRVLAVENVFIGASNELGAFESGVAGQVLGPAGAVCLGGAATMAIAAGWWTWFPALRDIDRFPGDPA
jgi:MFS family permease